MRVGVLKEVKRHEYRVGMTPGCASSYVQHGHEVLIESGAGLGAGFEDGNYETAGARILESAKAVADIAEMIVKVKEPQPKEYGLFREGQTLFTYLHLAAVPELADFLMSRKVDSVAYETIELEDGTLPCLQPMSEIAGRLSIQEGAKYLEKPFGGRGILLGGVPGIRRGKVAIIGGGIVGTNACKIAAGIGAEVTILDVKPRRLAYLDDIFGSRITTLYSDQQNVREVIREADVVIGAVLLAGRKAPHLIRREDLGAMKKGAVIVDVAIDQGGCTETSRATTHDEPVYIVDDVVHYCVANMPGVVALSSTIALTSQTRSYGLAIADHGLAEAVRRDTTLRGGVNILGGQCVLQPLAESLDRPHVPLETALKD